MGIAAHGDFGVVFLGSGEGFGDLAFVEFEFYFFGDDFFAAD